MLSCLYHMSERLSVSVCVILRLSLPLCVCLCAPVLQEYITEQQELYGELREEHYASLEDRKFVTLPAARLKVSYNTASSSSVKLTYV